MYEAFNFIRSKTDIVPEVGIILGSGLGAFADEIEGVRIPYSEIPSFGASSVSGHASQLVIGSYGGKSVVAMQGRFHYYEGYSIEQVVLPVRVMKLLGVKTLIVTNAAGGVNLDYSPGDLMIIRDHINLFGTNPLIGKNIDEFGPRFPDMSEAYSRELIRLVHGIADELGIKVKEGVYAGSSGPSYETPAETRMIRVLGADASGMSTVPEVIVANHCGIKVLGISCITNMASGILSGKLDHQEVIDTADRIKDNFLGLIREVIKNLP